MFVKTAIAAAIAFASLPGTAHATDALHLLAQVNHLTAQDAGGDTKDGGAVKQPEPPKPQPQPRPQGSNRPQ